MKTEKDNSNGNQAALEAARVHRTAHDPREPVTLSTGYRVRIVGVPPGLIDDAVARIEDPVIPTVYNEEKGRDEENPFDPAYLKALDNANKQRGIASFDIMIMFAVELVDPVPEDGTWIRKLQYLAKRGSIDFEVKDYDLDDPVEREFIFKRFVAVTSADMELIASRSGVTPEDMRKAEATF